MASWEPIESPSGLACEEITNRRFARITSTMRCSSGALVIVLGVVIGVRGVGGLAGMQLVEDPLYAILTGHRIVVDEPDLGRPSQAKPRAKLAAQERRGPFERPRARGLSLLIAKRRVHDPCELEIRADVDARQRDEADAGIVHVPRQQRCQLTSNLV